MSYLQQAESLMKVIDYTDGKRVSNLLTQALNRVKNWNPNPEAVSKEMVRPIPDLDVDYEWNPIPKWNITTPRTILDKTTKIEISTTPEITTIIPVTKRCKTDFSYFVTSLVIRGQNVLSLYLPLRRIVSALFI